MRSFVAGLALLVGCAATEPAPNTFCTQRTIGDPSAPVELAIVSRDHAGAVHAITDVAPMPVSLSSGEPGVVLGVRARNLDGCTVAIAIRNLDDPGTVAGAMVKLDDEGNVDPHDPLQFVELAMPASGDVINAVVQDATGHWGALRWSW